MKKLLIGLVPLMLFYFSFNRSVFAGNLPPTRGGKLPAISLPIPKDKSEKTYLGLGGSGFFKLNQDAAGSA